jgi:hypothetical protein
MIYEQCPETITHRQIRCVMFKGHKRLNKEMHHNFGGLGPYTPGMDPEAYIKIGSKATYMPWWRHFSSWWSSK